jgi:hypothetical protein
MFTSWLTKFEPVHIARTLQEREAIYRFRYQVYYEEFGRELGDPDHQRRWVMDPEDETPFTTLLYTGTPDAVTGTMRLRHWPAGQVPEHDVHELSLKRVPGFEARVVAEIGRLMIRPTLRGQLLLAAMARFGYGVICGEYGAELAFCYCSPGLVHYYRKLGFRPFGGPLVRAPDGIMVPLMNVLSDLPFYRREKSPLTAVIKQHFGRGKRPTLPLDPYLPLFEEANPPVELRAERIAPALQAAKVDAAIVETLARKGILIRVEPEVLMTREGFGEEEIYLILDGSFDVLVGDRRIRTMEAGEVFGELAFFLPDHRRTATVRARTRGTVLMLRGRTLRKLMEKEPKAAARVLLEVGIRTAQRAVKSAPVVSRESAAAGFPRIAAVG